MYLKSKNKNIDFITFKNEDNKLIGFVYLVTYNKTTMVLYLATDKASRSSGYGSEILSYLKKSIQNKIVLNMETIFDSEKEKNKVRRKNFYLKNEFKDSSYKLIDNNISFDILYFRDNFSFEDYKEILKRYSFAFKNEELIEPKN